MVITFFTFVFLLKLLYILFQVHPQSRHFHSVFIKTIKALAGWRVPLSKFNNLLFAISAIG